MVNSDGSFTYTPPSASFSGPDSFTYYVTDNMTGSATATVTLTVVATPPVAGDVAIQCSPNSNALGSVMPAISGGAGTVGVQAANDSTAAGGSFAIDASGAVTYTAPGDFTGSDSFSYTAIDSGNQTSSGNVNIVVS